MASSDTVRDHWQSYVMTKYRMVLFVPEAWSVAQLDLDYMKALWKFLPLRQGTEYDVHRDYGLSFLRHPNSVAINLNVTLTTSGLCLLRPRGIQQSFCAGLRSFGTKYHPCLSRQDAHFLSVTATLSCVNMRWHSASASGNDACTVQRPAFFLFPWSYVRGAQCFDESRSRILFITASYSCWWHFVWQDNVLLDADQNRPGNQSAGIHITYHIRNFMHRSILNGLPLQLVWCATFRHLLPSIIQVDCSWLNHDEYSRPLAWKCKVSIFEPQSV